MKVYLVYINRERRSDIPHFEITKIYDSIGKAESYIKEQLDLYGSRHTEEDYKIKRFEVE